ncbi:hypothetical protein JCM10512_1839 [Bacteroides reticulotermitis JCM 10512]|uniref:Uncharacterized protein n=1 Tax=Bacteroides reticulotermitis JCM 10512 TaxID=1445607 RepID=W4URH4_9BACE|nr:hypothetical protein JCM10512_1839 [Bacteroides reticulotermitis JCM 10512]
MPVYVNREKKRKRSKREQVGSKMTKRNLYLFNPEHDLALASGESHYMAPASARQMANDLALLPIWYAKEGSGVLASSAYNLDFLKQMKELLDIDVQLVTQPEISHAESVDFLPWGWSPALRKRLLTLGADGAQLPSEAYISALRNYSHRSQAVRLLSKLQLNQFFCGESFYLKTLEECEAFVESRETCLLKAPLSGSGKGLNWCKGTFTDFISGWCARVASSQGGVLENLYIIRWKTLPWSFISMGLGRLALPVILPSKQVGAECMRVMSYFRMRKYWQSCRPMYPVRSLRDCVFVWKRNWFGCSVVITVAIWEWI